MSSAIKLSGTSKPPRLSSAFLFSLLGLAASAFNLTAQAQLVTFEQTPGGATPVDNTPLSDPYAINGSGSVRFYFDTNANNTFDVGIDVLPVFEIVGNGDPQNGFFNNALQQYDIPAAGAQAQLGSFFLRQPAAVGSVTSSFIVEYQTAQTITGLSGEIWDIDGVTDPALPAFGNEQWRIDALNASNQVIASVLSPIGAEALGPFNARPWTFAFSGLPVGLDKISITFIGTKTDGVGLAFNNFSPTVAVVPEPMSSALLALGLASVAVASRRRRHG